jgi:excisionase family DNA binding protein
MTKPTRLSYTIEETEEVTGLGRTSIYKEISSGKLDARKAGRRTLITAASVQAFLASLPQAAIRPAARKDNDA